MKFVGCLALSLIGLQGPASAMTLVVGSSAETTLNEDQQNNNMGGHGFFHAGSTNGLSKRRGLVAFDVSSIPSDAIVTSTSLSISVPSGNISSPSSFGLHLMLTAWAEGDKTGNNGALAVAGEATWNSTGFAAWGAPGAAADTDYVSTSSASTPVSGLGSYSWSGEGLRLDVQSWVSGSQDNNGWILISELEGTAGTARRFSAEGAPTLTVEYTIPEPTSPLLLGLAGIAFIMRRRR